MTHGMDYIVILLLFVLGLFLLFLGKNQIARLANSGGLAARACCNDFGVPITDDSVRLIARYLRRTDRYRQSWVWIGIGASIASAILWRSPGGGGWGLVTFPPTSNVFLMALGFWFVGLVRSELYSMRPRYHGPRTASLEVREVHRYLPNRMVYLPRISAVLAVALVVTDQLLAQPSLHATTVLVLGVLTTIALAVTEAAQRGIALRSRPTVGPDLRAADEAIRRMASWSVAYGASGLITLIASIEAFLITDQVPTYVTSHLAGSYSRVMATSLFPRNLFVWLGVALFVWSVGLAVQAGKMVRPEPRSLGRATAELA
jgi:hypothetical protein